MLLALCAALPAAAGGPGPAQARGLDLIHQGRIAEGVQVLHAQADATPGDRSALFYAGVGSWWRYIVEAGGDGAAVEAMDYFQRSLAAGSPAPGDRHAAFEAGTSWMLLAHLEGARGSVMRAALDARRGKKILDELKRTDPGNRDLGFALGSYDYYADRLPRLMKGLRALLFLPGGDASMGLAELERASRDGRVFSCEATLVLADIYGSSLEDKYDMALDLLDGLVARYPENPLFLSGRAEIESEVGEVDAALRDLAEARRHVAASDAVLAAGLDYLEVRVRDKAYETAAAIRIAEPLVASAAAKASPVQHARMRFRLGEMYERSGASGKAMAIYRALDGEDVEDRLRKKVSKKLAGELEPAPPSYNACQPAVTLLRQGKPLDAEASLRALTPRFPKDPIVAFFLAESLFAQESKGARAAYDEAYHLAGGKQPWIRAWSLVRLGDLDAAAGRREDALHRYNQAWGIDKWGGRGIVAYRLARVASLPSSRAAARPAAP